MEADWISLGVAALSGGTVVKLLEFFGGRGDRHMKHLESVLELYGKSITELAERVETLEAENRELRTKLAECLKKS